MEEASQDNDFRVLEEGCQEQYELEPVNVNSLTLSHELEYLQYIESGASIKEIIM